MKKTLLFIFCFSINFCFWIELSWNVSRIWQTILNDSKTVIVSLTGITASNAGKILNQRTGINNFKTKFILTWWVVKTLNLQNLQESFKKTNEIKLKINSVKSKNIDIWTVQTLDPELIQYPDRIRVSQKLKLIFDTNEQFQNYKKHIDTDIKETDNKKKLDNFILEKLVKECKKNTKCAWKLSDIEIKKKVENWLNWSQKTITTEEYVDYNLIPLDLEQIEEINSPTFNLNQDPKDVRISLETINYRLKDLYEINNIERIINSDLNLLTWTTSYSGNAELYCKNFYIPEERNYDLCVRLKNSLDNMRWNKKTWYLLNGFTIWDSYSIMWKKSLRVNYLVDDKEVFYWRFNATFGYAFWLRIPMEYELDIQHAYFPINSWIPSPNAKIKFKIDTIDADAQRYKALWLSNDKIHEGKEFVLKLYANAGARIDLLDETVFDKNWNLISLLGDLLWIEGLDDADRSKDFKTPFGEDERINILDLNYDIPVYSISIASINANLQIKSYIEWVIKFAYEKINMWNISNNVEVNNTDWIDLSWVARFKSNDYLMDQIWGYSKFGIILKDFFYFPRFITDIKVWANIRVDIPLRGSEKFNIWPYTVYHFEFEWPWLWRHSWTNGSINRDLWKIYHPEYLPPISEAKKNQISWTWYLLTWNITMTWYLILSWDNEENDEIYSWNLLLTWYMIDWLDNTWFVITGMTYQNNYTIKNIYIEKLFTYYEEIESKYSKWILTIDKFKENLTNQIYIFREQYWDQINDELNKKFDKLIKNISLIKTKDDIKNIKNSILNIDNIEFFKDNNVLSKETTDSLDSFVEKLFNKFAKLWKKDAIIKINSIKTVLQQKISIYEKKIQTQTIKLNIQLLTYIIAKIDLKILNLK